MTAKFSAIILLPIYVVIVILLLIFRPLQLNFPFTLKFVERYLHQERLRRLVYSGVTLVIFIVFVYVLIFANYGFQAEPLVRDADEQAKLEALLHKTPLAKSETAVQAVSALARSVPIPGRDYFTAFSVMMGFTPQVSEDGKYLVITARVGTDARHRVFYKDLEEPYGMVTELIDNFEHEYSFEGNDGPLFYFKTNHEAPRGRVIAIDTRKPEPRNWKEVIPQGPEALQGVSLVGNQFVATYLKDAQTQVKMFDTKGQPV
ncbi:hypothetical protein HUU05_27830, partial [candidate division KSB1 bacterium]|nr:hypothetical protein [candidate division KSB1 bacterium]